jgi:hypothetical protein
MEIKKTQPVYSLWKNVTEKQLKKHKVINYTSLLTVKECYRMFQNRILTFLYYLFNLKQSYIFICIGLWL